MSTETTHQISEGASEDDNHDIGKDEKYYKASVFLSNIVDDPKPIEIGEVDSRFISETVKW